MGVIYEEEPMRSMQKIITPLLLLAPFVAHAEAIDLVCTDNTGFSVSFEIDTSHNVVLASGKPARKVFIDKHTITFLLDMADREWFHSINRNTGNMTIQAPDKSILPTYTCERAKPKL
ncbi:hypothetical protein [Azotobacter vinelandii]